MLLSRDIQLKVANTGSEPPQIVGFRKLRVLLCTGISIFVQLFGITLAHTHGQPHRTHDL
jgi:hypothetical protein